LNFKLFLYLLGVRIDNVSMSEALEKIREFLSDGRQHYIVTSNPEFLVLAQKDQEFCDILNKADLNIPDGIGIVWAARWLGESLKERVTGVDLIEKLKIKNEKLKIFLLGGKNGVAQKIKAEWPAIVSCSENLDEAINLINNCRPDILLVALGAPKQEKWIAQNLAKILSVKVAIGVGGAFDFISGRIKRAPKIFQAIGLEWLWRVLREPKRLPRLIKAVIIFPLLVLRTRSYRKKLTGTNYPGKD